MHVDTFRQRRTSRARRCWVLAPLVALVGCGGGTKTTMSTAASSASPTTATTPAVTTPTTASTATAPSPTTPTTPATTPTTKPAKPITASVSAGKTVFGTSCRGCHTLADTGPGGTIGPNLDQLKPSDALVVTQVTNGGGAMPSFAQNLSRQQIADVARYVSTVAGKHGKKSGG